jgi:hypothetical protein
MSLVCVTFNGMKENLAREVPFRFFVLFFSHTYKSFKTFSVISFVLLSFVFVNGFVMG